MNTELIGQVLQSWSRFDALIASAPPEWLEDDHTWIQWCFPLQTPSGFNCLAPILDDDDVKLLKAMSYTQSTQVGFAEAYLAYLRVSKGWLSSSHDHNRRRITRVIKSLVLLGSYDEAERVYRQCSEMLINGATDKESIVWWNNALVV